MMPTRIHLLDMPRSEAVEARFRHGPAASHATPKTFKSARSGSNLRTDTIDKVTCTASGSA